MSERTSQLAGDSPARARYVASLRAGAPSPSPSPSRSASSSSASASSASASATSASALDEATRDTRVGERLDAFRASFEGPYRVSGATVFARPMFRMQGGANQASAARHAQTVAATAARIRGASGFRIQAGNAGPAELIAVTQALIDAGKLPPPRSGPHGADVASRIRAMQWEYGLGLDCSTYVNRALVAVTGRTRKELHIAEVGFESFRSLETNRGFARVAISTVRPGDLVRLDPLPPEIYGHNVIVRSREVPSARWLDAFATQHGSVARSFVSGPGPIHVIEVDSSWGAGPDGADYGGGRRDMWLFDEGARAWGYLDPQTSPPTFCVSRDGPATYDRFRAAYRPKATLR